MCYIYIAVTSNPETVIKTKINWKTSFFFPLSYIWPQQPGQDQDKEQLGTLAGLPRGAEASTFPSGMEMEWPQLESVL